MRLESLTLSFNGWDGVAPRLGDLDASAHALLTRRAQFPKLTRLGSRSFRTSQAVETRVRAAFR